MNKLFALIYIFILGTTIDSFAGNPNYVDTGVTQNHSTSAPIACTKGDGTPGTYTCATYQMEQKQCKNWCPKAGSSSWVASGNSRPLNQIINTGYLCQDPDLSNNSWTATNCTATLCPPYCCNYDRYGNCITPYCYTCNGSVTVADFYIKWDEIPFSPGGDAGASAACTFSPDGPNKMKGSTTVACKCVDGKGDPNDRCWTNGLTNRARYNWRWDNRTGACGSCS